MGLVGPASAVVLVVGWLAGFVVGGDGVVAEQEHQGGVGLAAVLGIPRRRPTQDLQERVVATLGRRALRHITAGFVAVEPL
ncbi:hypothetical protein B7486_61410, partial [cyanobacterium TDX16]